MIFKELARGRFKGHPIHGMLVHFPIGLFSAGFLFDLASLWAAESHLPIASFYCIAGGVAGGLAAMLFGLIDYIDLAENRRLFKKACMHACVAATNGVYVFCCRIDFQTAGVSGYPGSCNRYSHTRSCRFFNHDCRQFYRR